MKKFKIGKLILGRNTPPFVIAEIGINHNGNIENAKRLIDAAAEAGVDYVKFIRTFSDRIYHVHMKDAWWGHGDGTVGVFGAHTTFCDPRRQWDFRSVGRGDVNFEEIIVALNDVRYAGPLSIEWEDGRMDRFHGATESCEFVKALDFKPNEMAFDSAFDKKNQ